MTASTKLVENMDQILERSVDDKDGSGSGHEDEVKDSSLLGKDANTHLPSGSNIEEKEDDDPEPCEQIKFMVEGLSVRQKRRTLQMLQPLISPLLSSTMADGNTQGEQSSTKDKQDETLYTSGGEVTLGVNSSVSKIVFQAPRPQTFKLRLFSGTVPVPKGEVDYRTWNSAARRLKKKDDLAEEEKCEKLQNSLLDPALSLVCTALDCGNTGKVLSLLAKAYDDVKSVRDLQNEYQSSIQKLDESCSDFLTRLYLLLQEVNRKGIVDYFDSELLKQFIYGCSDESLVLKLRLEEKDEMCSPPDYGALLLSIRKEESRRRARKQTAQQRARVQQVKDVDSSAGTSGNTVATSALHKEVKSLREEVAFLKQQQEPAPPLQQQTRLPPPKQQSQGKSTNERVSLHFCFQCGLEGHKIWTCGNPANPNLVANKFAMVKMQKQGNWQGSR